MAQCAIQSEDASLLAFADGSSTVAETAGSVVITVVRSGSSETSLTAQYATSPVSARANDDYMTTSGSLTFAPGVTQQTISVPIINDEYVENDEVFTITLSVLGAQTTHAVTIQSEDVPAVLAFASAASTVAETARNALITVVRTGSTAASLTAQYATSPGTAEANVDYTTTSGMLWFQPGQTKQTISVPITNDLNIEDDETFTVTLSALGVQTTHTVTIQSDDGPGVLSFASGASTVAETAGNASITVVRTGNTATSVTVQFATSPGTATANVDYTTTSGTLTFGPGVTQQTISVPITNDPNVENDETFTVTLSAPGGGAVLGAQTTHTVTIQSEDVLPGVLALASGASTVAETVGSAVITVVRTGNTATSVTVQYATSPGTATAGADYATTSGTLKFAAGVTQQTISVPITNDPNVEGYETFILTLSAPGGEAVLGAQTTHTVTILNNDTALMARKAGYHGIASRTDAPGFGGFVANTTAKGSISGHLQIEGMAYRFSGNIETLTDAWGSFSTVFDMRASGRRVGEFLTLHFMDGGSQLVGSFEREDGVVFDISAERDAAPPSSGSVTQAGHYTALLSADTPSPVRGFLLVNVKAGGGAKLTGSLPDGAKLTLGTHISETGGLTIFIPCYQKRSGYLAGSAQFTTNTNIQLSGVQYWKKPAGKDMYANGLNNVPVALTGASYTPRMQMLDDFNDFNREGFLRLSGGGIANTLKDSLMLFADNSVFIPSVYSYKPRLKMHPQTGLFSGSFRDSDGRSRVFKGVCVQQPGSAQDMAEGFFAGISEPGRVELVAGSIPQ